MITPKEFLEKRQAARLAYFIDEFVEHIALALSAPEDRKAIREHVYAEGMTLAWDWEDGLRFVGPLFPPFTVEKRIDDKWVRFPGCETYGEQSSAVNTQQIAEKALAWFQEYEAADFPTKSRLAQFGLLTGEVFIIK